MSTSHWLEEAAVFECAGDRLIGIFSVPPEPTSIGVVIIVGGPQYRAGSHRQFTLLARQLAVHGIPSLRFDYRGMGDSEGTPRTFENVDADVRTAVDAFFARVPGLERIALWGLCDGASAAMYYSGTDRRVSHLVLLNPWVHSETGAARARLKHYYLARLTSASFWHSLLSGKVSIKASIGDLAASVHKAGSHDPDAAQTARPSSGSYIDRMLHGLRGFDGRVLFILSDNDLVSQEFRALVASNRAWRAVCASPKVKTEILPNANHTFSSLEWRKTVADWTRDCIVRSP
jgi:exosortase A-associated hydrolase 1